MLRIVKSHQLTIVFVLLLLIAFVFFGAYKPFELEMPDSLLKINFQLQNQRVNKLLFVILLVLQMILLQRLIFRFQFIQSRGILPLLILVVLNLAINNSQVLIGNSLVLVVFVILTELWRSYKCTGLALQLFNAGLVIGISYLVYSPVIFLLPFVYIVYVLLRPVRLQELLFPLLGFIVPIFLLKTIQYVFGNAAGNTFVHLPPFYPAKQALTLSTIEYVYLGFNALLLLIASIHIYTHFVSKKILIRRIFTSLLWLFIISLLVVYFVPSAYLFYLPCATIALSVLYTHYFNNVKENLLNNIIFIVFLVFSVFMVF